jgi:amino-acid N-acetyltransferase
MRRARITLRTADPSHAAKLHALITANLEEGHLLPRTLGELEVRAERFTIALRGRTIVGGAELAPLSAAVADVRSLAVDASVRGNGVGTEIVDALRRRARREGFEKLCAFTHTPGYFIHMGFSIVPHLWLPEKIFTDCVRCPHFRQCGQYAMVISVTARESELERDRPLDAPYGEAPGGAPSAPRFA